MKKMTYFLSLTIVILLGGIYLTKNLSLEMKGIVDQLNPFVSESSSYLKTVKPDKALEHGYYEYQQDTFDEAGEKIPLIFSADHQLKLDHYLKITHKGQHVITYEEVAKEAIPKKALAQLNK